MNLAWQKLFMRDGAVNHLDMQALAPISNPVEMDESLANVVLKLQSGSLYPDLFYEAFGDSVITGEHTLKAISQFLLTLVSSHSKYDSVMLHQAVFTVQENNGYQLFRQHCSSCHTEPLFTNDEFMNNGLKPDPALMDVGRYKVTLNPEDLLKFKVPSLRNIEFSYPYMHDGRFRKLSQVLDHYTTGIVESNTLADTLRLPIILTSNEKVDLVAFLLTLTDRSFLFNPQFSYPKDLFFPVARD
jgi:cytochrome c peroxidase